MNLANFIDVVEMLPDKGAVKAISVPLPGGYVIVNTKAGSFIENYSINFYRKN